MIKTFWFDLGNVILPFNFSPAYKRLSNASGIKVAEYKKFFRDRPELESQLDEGYVTGVDLYRLLKKELGMAGVSFSEFKHIWNDIFRENKAVANLIYRLKKDGAQLILISNTNRLHFLHIKKTYPVISQFDKLILSYELQIRKPKKKIYHRALSLSRALPHEILYIDDRSDLTDAAGTHGVHTHTFRTFNELRTNLKRLKVM